MDPVARAFEEGELPADFAGHTLADSIDVPAPRNWRKAVDRVKATNGAYVRVTDEEITEAIKATGRLAGIFAEPAAAAGANVVTEGEREAGVRARYAVPAGVHLEVASAAALAWLPGFERAVHRVVRDPDGLPLAPARGRAPLRASLTRRPARARRRRPGRGRTR